MEPVYQIRIGGQIISRMTEQELFAAIQEGSIGAFHQASLDGSNWYTATEILQATTSMPEASTSPPQASGYPAQSPTQTPAAPGPGATAIESFDPAAYGQPGSSAPHLAPVQEMATPQQGHPPNNDDPNSPQVEQAPFAWHVSVKSERFGPFNEQQLQEMVNDSRLGPRDLVWREGFADWVPAKPTLPYLFRGQRKRKEQLVPPEEQSFSLLAVVSLVFSLTWVGCVVGVILAILGMIDIAGSEGYRKGVVFAVLGLVLGLIGTAAGVFLLISFS